MKAPTESDVLAACLQYLELRKILAWRTNNVGIFDPMTRRFRSFKGLKGVSDILAVLPPGGRLLAVECKRRGGKLSPEQEWFLEQIRNAGGVSLVCHSVDELIKGLEGLT